MLIEYPKKWAVKYCKYCALYPAVAVFIFIFILFYPHRINNYIIWLRYEPSFGSSWQSS